MLLVHPTEQNLTRRFFSAGHLEKSRSLSRKSRDLSSNVDKSRGIRTQFFPLIDYQDLRFARQNLLDPRAHVLFGNVDAIADNELT
jgi:hypothetical protein